MPLITIVRESRLLRFSAESQDCRSRRAANKGLLGLLGGPAVDADILRSWLPGWKAAFTTVSQADPPPRFHSCRLNYYLRAFEEILESEQPLSMLWALLSTWTRITSLLPPEAPERAAWQEACARHGLLGPPFAERVDALDSYLDTIEEIWEAWAHRQGIE